MKYSTYNNFKNKVAGYLFDESDVNLIVGRSTYKQSETKGRALLKYDNMISVMQLYSMVKFKTELEYKDKIKELIQILMLCIQVNKLQEFRFFQKTCFWQI